MGIRLGGGAEISSKSGLNFRTLSLQFTTHAGTLQQGLGQKVVLKFYSSIARHVKGE